MQNYLAKIILFLFLICFVSNSLSQNTLDTISTSIPFTVYKTTNDTISIHTILKSDRLFQSSDVFTNKTHPKDTYWIKLDFNTISNALKTYNLWYLKFNNFGYGSLFSLDNGSISEKVIGQFETEKEADLVKLHSETSFASSSLFQDRFLYLKVQRVISREFPNSWNFNSINQVQHVINKDYSTQQNTWSVLPMHIFAGICIIMVLLTLAFYVYLKRLEFLFYSLYVFWLLVLLSGYELKIYDFLFGNNLLLKYWFYEVVQMFINSSYIFFVMFYLKTKEDYPILQQLLKFMLVLQLIVFIVDSTFIYYEFFIGHIYIINIERFALIISSTVGLIYLVLKGKNVLAYFIVYGLFFFLIGTIVHFYLTSGSALLEYKSRYFLMIGCILDIIIFAYGLVYKVFLEQNEKLRYQREALTQKNKALRAQINPHFIFNSLSSIQHLITSNNKVSALKYLSKFSRLTRNVLESSIEPDILLSEEIKMLNDYLELESLRFKNSFSYTIDASDNVDTGAIEIPILVIQPFVENAILHGLLNKKDGEKILNINFYQDNSFLICEIDDNGVGRGSSTKRNTIHKKKSRGLQVTKERLEMFNTLNDETNNITIIDKKTDDGMPLGTKVIIKILIH